MSDSKKTSEKTEPPEWKFEPKLLAKYLAEVKYILPVFIPLPDGKYQVFAD